MRSIVILLSFAVVAWAHDGDHGGSQPEGGAPGASQPAPEAPDTTVAESDEAFGQWVREQIQNGLRGQELADAIHERLQQRFRERHPDSPGRGPGGRERAQDASPGRGVPDRTEGTSPEGGAPERAGQGRGPWHDTGPWDRGDFQRGNERDPGSWHETGPWHDPGSGVQRGRPEDRTWGGGDPWGGGGHPGGGPGGGHGGGPGGGHGGGHGRGHR